MNSVAHRKNFSCIKDGADKLLDYHGVFTAFHELFLPDCTPGDTLSSEAREGLAYMFKLLAEDAINTHTPLFGAWEELTRWKAMRKVSFSIRPDEMQETLEDVRYMTAFLQRAFKVWNEAGYSETPEEREGLLTVLHIISDKARAVSEALAPGKEAQK